MLFVAAMTAVLAVCSTGCSQHRAAKPDWFTNPTYFEEKNGMYEEMPVFPRNIVMVGDDYIDRGIWSEFYGDTTLKNRGITYDATEHVLYRIEPIATRKPAKIFVSAGFNDLLHGTAPEVITENIKKIFTTAKKASPNTKLYWLNIVLAPLDEKQAAAGAQVNEAVKELSAKAGFTCIDLDAVLSEGIKSGAYSWDGGKYLNGAGYEAYAKAIEDEVGKPALNTADDKTYPLEVSDYYKHRVSMFRSLPATEHKIVMLGNSLNNNGLWEELFPMGYVINRGISGDVIDGVHQRIDEFVGENPDKIFLMTGTNDFINDASVPVSEVWNRYESLIADLRNQCPSTLIYVQSILPLNPKTKFYEGFNEKAAEVNKMLSAGKERYQYFYLDIASLLSDENGDLRSECTTDGIHLSALGYFLWAAELAKGNRMMQNLDFNKIAE